MIKSLILGNQGVLLQAGSNLLSADQGKVFTEICRLAVPWKELSFEEVYFQQ